MLLVAVELEPVAGVAGAGVALGVLAPVFEDELPLLDPEFDVELFELELELELV